MIVYIRKNMEQIWWIVSIIVSVLVLGGLIWFFYKKTTISGSIGGNKDKANNSGMSGSNK